MAMAKRPIDIAGMMARRQETEVGAKLFLWSNPPKAPPSIALFRLHKTNITPSFCPRFMPLFMII